MEKREKGNCGKCEGTGVYEGKEKACPACSGTGWLDGRPPIEGKPSKPRLDRPVRKRRPF